MIVVQETQLKISVDIMLWWRRKKLHLKTMSINQLIVATKTLSNFKTMQENCNFNLSHYFRFRSEDKITTNQLRKYITKIQI